ncbi:hypothetical protein JCM11251_005305 [Rhodosporidiobolus azoricus]
MGYVPSFCQLAGCAPSAAGDLPNAYRIEQALEDVEDKTKRERLQEALQQLAAEEEPRLEVTVIESDELVQKHVDSLRLVPACTAADSYEFGFVTGKTHHQDYLVSYGPCIFVMSSAVPVLYLATGGRMTMKKLWQLAMQQGHNDGSAGYVLEGVDYGGIERSIDQFLNALPGLNDIKEDDLEKEVLGWLDRSKNVQKLKKLLMLEQKWWMWMAMDDFTDPPSSSPGNASALSSLPFDILVHLSSLLTLPALLSLTSTSRTVRSSLFSTSTKRNRLASAWLNTSGQYWLPIKVDLGVDFTIDKAIEEKHVGVKKVEMQDLREKDDWWNYLVRCAAESGSMRNRKRVWGAALSVEIVAEREGLL